MAESTQQIASAHVSGHYGGFDNNKTQRLRNEWEAIVSEMLRIPTKKLMAHRAKATEARRGYRAFKLPADWQALLDAEAAQLAGRK